MRYSTVSGDLKKVKTNLLAIPCFQGEAPNKHILKSLGPQVVKHIQALAKRENFRGKAKSTILLRAEELGKGAIKSDRLFLIGMGKRADWKPDHLRIFGALTAKQSQKLNCRRFTLVTDGNLPSKTSIKIAEISQLITEGATLALYSFNKYKKKPSKEETARLEKDMECQIWVQGKSGLTGVRHGQRLGHVLSAATNYARNLVNEPANILNPSYLEREARKLKGGRIKVRIYKDPDMKRMKMGALLGVAQGSPQRPRLIHLSYTPAGAKSKKHIAVVGKGVTFDSGGISIKPSKGMETMKMDMAGAATVLGIFHALKQHKVAWKVTGVIPAAENMPSGNAQRPGDIVRAMNGKTIEVINTDAEGRLILADALCFACKEKPNEIVDIATLTGACIVALGQNIAGVLGNNDKFIKEIISAGEKAGEKLWQLPLEPNYKEGLKSEVADMKNVTGQGAGTITGALFLSEFVDVKRWIHIDIAGPGMGEKETPYTPKGGTGFGIRTLVEYMNS